MLFLAACDVIEEPYLVGADEAKEIISFSVDSVEGVIDQSLKTVTLDFPGGTDVSHLAPVIVVSPYATVEPASGVTQDFTQPVVYKVTAYDGTSVEYQAYALVHDADNEKSILSFRVEDPECEGVINEIAKTVTLNFAPGTEVTHLVPVIEVSEGATVSPASGEAQDFTQPVEYTVTAMNGTTATYVVSAVVPLGGLEPTGKTVLLHDYTGVKCVNCPAAANIAHQLQETYGDRLIVMSVHAGYQAQPSGGFPDFLTDEGTEWYNNNASNPLGSVNRVQLLTGYTLQASAWTDAVAEAFQEPQQIEIRISNVFDESTRRLTATVDAMALETIDKTLNITVCLIEDNIVGKQITPTGLMNDYVHRHVFRGTFNGAYGDNFTFDQNRLYQQSFSMVLPEEYNASNCSVVAYIYDITQDMMILQTAQQPL